MLNFRTNSAVSTMLMTTDTTDRYTGVVVSPWACRIAWKAPNTIRATISKERMRR